MVLKEIIEDLIKDLRINGYCSILNLTAYTELELQNIEQKLLEVFKSVIIADVDVNKKYFIVNEGGKNTVLKLLDNTIYTYTRTLKSKPDFYINPNPFYDSEIKRLSKTKRTIERAKIY